MASRGNQETLVDFSVPNFEKLVETRLFVDKTLMIRDIFDGPLRILITAPPRFGKSINLDMVKQFLEVEVDQSGAPIPTNDKKKNYKLFKDHRLKIYNDEHFNKHFGKYPVIYIDFNALNNVRDFEHMLDVFKGIVRKSFIQHSYILDPGNAKNIFSRSNGFDQNDFRKRVSSQLIKKLDVHDLQYSFENLSTVLYTCFEKEVFVLIDNYDAFTKSLLSDKNNNLDAEQIMHFIKTSINHLLENNKCVGRVLLTGVLPVTGDGIHFDGWDIECHWFMGDHPLCKYFGLMSVELEIVLDQSRSDDDEKANMRKTISEFYGGYENRSVEVYNMWSVRQYVCRQEVQSYCKYIKIFEQFFKKNQVRRTVEKLLLNGDFTISRAKTLSTTDILQLNEILRAKVKDVSCSVTYKLVCLLYHFGYFSVTNTFDKGLVSLRIPNESIKYELASVHLETIQSYDVIQEYVYNVWSIIDTFKPDNNNQYEILKDFGNHVNYWYQNVPSEERHSLLSRLYFILLAQPKYSRTFFGAEPVFHICLKNKHEVAICITALNVVDKKAATVRTIRTAAETAYNNIKSLEFFREFEELSYKIRIGIGYKNTPSGMCIASSYGQDNSRQYKILTFNLRE